MAKDSTKSFIEKYRPVAEEVGKEIGVSPNVILSQWALESGWGKAVPGQNNIAGIKDFTGGGTEARDNKLGTTAKYANFSDPETFGIYYASMIKRQFPNAVNAGDDITAFTRGLVSGKSGAYFQADPHQYAVGLTSIHNTLPGSQQAPRPSEQDIKAPMPSDESRLIAAPAAKPVPARTDKSGADPGERFLFGGAGAATGTAALGLDKLAQAREQAAIRRAGLEEAERLRQRRLDAARVTPPAAPPQGVVPEPPARAGGLNVEPTSPQTTRILQGTTGDAGTTGRARMSGFAAETSQTAAAQKQAYDTANRLRSLGLVAEDAPTFFAKQPGMTSSPSGVLIPRSEPAPTIGPRSPEGQIGGAKVPPVPTAPGAPALDIYKPPPASPSLASKTASGLEAVGSMFKSMMAPVSKTVGSAVRYGAPTLGGLSAGLDVAELLHEYQKPEVQRDYTKMALKGAGAIGGGLSMIPGAATVGVPLALGASAIQAYREDPEMLNRLIKRMSESKPLESSDPMTGVVSP